MKKIAIVCTIVPILLQAQSLKELLDTAAINNNQIASKQYVQEAKLKEVEASKSSYFPTIDVGSSYQNLSQKTPGLAGDTYNAHLKLGIDLYDGGVKSNTIKKNKALLEASKLDTLAYTKSLELAITQDFYNIQSTQASLEALKEKNIQLEAELRRIEQFYKVGSATKDEIDKLQAELSNNLYHIETTKYQLLSLKKLLSIKVGANITSIDKSEILTPTYENKELSDEIKAMRSNMDSYTYAANSINAAYMPKIRLENTFNLYEYGRSDASHLEGLDNQNRLLLTFSLRLYDNGSVEKQKESILLQKKSLQENINQATKLQDANTQLAVSKINTSKAQINSAKRSLDSASSAYETILEKYKVGAVDNIAYLDALSSKTNAKAQYKKALNDLQVAYATYYYYTNKNIKDYTK